MNALVFGRRKLGKSTLALHLACSAAPGVIIFDPNGQFDCGLILSDPLDLQLALDEKTPLIVYRPINDVQSEFSELAAILWPYRNFALLIDEGSQVQTFSKPLPMLDRFVRLSNTHSVHLIQTMHRPVDAATICRSLATDWYMFRSTQESDLKAIEERCGEEVRELVSTIAGEQGKGNPYVHWDDNVAQFELVQDSAAWYQQMKVNLRVLQEAKPALLNFPRQTAHA